MSIFLLGGGWDRAVEDEVWGGFAAQVRDRATRPRVGLVVIGVEDEDLAYHQRFVEVLERIGLGEDLVVTRVAEGASCPAEALRGLDGLVVGGGHTPSYLTALAPVAADVRALVADGVPYAGFSAGSAVAATHALVGGWRHDGVPVCPEDSGEEVEELAVHPGLGLVEGTVDVHASSWGTVSRLAAAIAAGLAPRGVAIDEDTCLRFDPAGPTWVPGDPVTRTGAGRAWWVDPAEDAADDAVVVRRS